MIPKNTLVTLSTTNGGVIAARLLLNYRPTFAATIEVNGHCVVIDATRILSVVTESA